MPRPSGTIWYLLGSVALVGIPILAALVLGTPEIALPANWSSAQARIEDGSLPPDFIVNGLSLILAGVWLADLWFVLVGVFDWKSAESPDAGALGRRRGRDTELDRDDGIDPDVPSWYHEAAPIFDQPFTDDFPRVVLPPDDSGPTDAAAEPPEPLQDTMLHHAEPPYDPASDDTVSEAELMDDPQEPSASDPPMIVPVRAYYFSRTADTLRSISAQFLNTPTRWDELRALNAASPGVGGAGADSLLPEGTALALPGDPLPWGKPDPVYLWTLAEKFLFTAWGREPTPEEVVPFWRGLTGGAQLGEASLAATLEERGIPQLGADKAEKADTADAEDEVDKAAAKQPAAPDADEPAPPAAKEPKEPAAEEPAKPEAKEPAAEKPAEPEPAEPAEPEPAPEPAAPAAEQPPASEEPTAAPAPTPAHKPLPPAHEPAAYQPPAHEPLPPVHEPAPYQPPVPPSHEPLPPAHEPAPYQPPAYEPQPPAYEPAAYQTPPYQPAAYQPPAYEPAPYQPPAHEPAPFQSLLPPSHEPPPPVHEPPAPPPIYEPGAYQPPLPPSHEPPPPLYSGTGPVPDFGPAEPDVPYVESEAPRVPHFMPSLTGAVPGVTGSEAEVVARASRGLAGTAVGDAMLLWQLSRLRRRRPGARVSDAADQLQQSLQQSARMDSLNLIEAAMRHLRGVTVGQLKEKPGVLAVRVGLYGFEVLLDAPIEAPDGWNSASGGYVLELPEGVTAEDLDTIGQGPSLCPALVPVGDTLEGPLLLNIEEIGCLIVSGPGGPSVALLNSIVGTLGSSPLAGDIRVITVGLDTPAGLPGWERVHSTSFDSPRLDELLSQAHTGSGASVDVLVVGPGNDVLIQRAGQIAATPGSRLALVGATSSVAARWPWRIHVDETTTAVVHPIASTMVAAQAAAPQMVQLFSEADDPSLLAPPRF